MLFSPSIRMMFSKMIIFNGKYTCNPNTLNNEIHTYYFADYWQEENMKEKKYNR